MIEVTDKGGRTWQIKDNPWLPAHRNLTHQQLLVRYRPDKAEMLRDQAFKLSPEYQREQERLAWDRLVREYGR